MTSPGYTLTPLRESGWIATDFTRVVKKFTREAHRAIYAQSSLLLLGVLY